MKDSVIRYGVAFATGAIDFCTELGKWFGRAFLQLAPPAIKWTAVMVVAGFTSITIMASVFFVSVNSNPDTLLGVLDRVQSIQQQEQEAQLEYIQARRSKIDAEVLGLNRRGGLDYCMTKDDERLQPDGIWMDWNYEFSEWD